MNELKIGDKVKIVLEVTVNENVNGDVLASEILDLAKVSVLPALNLELSYSTITKMRG